VTLVFETHATSLDNEAGLASGWFDVDLSPTGEEQARELGVRRRNDDLAAVFCSDQRRAWRTADIAFGDRAIAILRDARLRECDYGELTRRPTLDIDRRRALHVAAPFPGGESYQQAAARVAAWLRDVSVTFTGRTVLAIGHRATFYALEHLIRDVPLAEALIAPWQWQPGWSYDLPAEPGNGWSARLT
jgi:broad specificity phosphatase PhoE